MVLSNARPQATPSGRAGALIRRKRSNYSDLTRPGLADESKGNPLISGKSRLASQAHQWEGWRNTMIWPYLLFYGGMKSYPGILGLYMII